jgi:hypothetical protein
MQVFEGELNRSGETGAIQVSGAWCRVPVSKEERAGLSPARFHLMPFGLLVLTLFTLLPNPTREARLRFSGTRNLAPGT